MQQKDEGSIVKDIGERIVWMINYMFLLGWKGIEVKRELIGRCGKRREVKR